MAGTFSTLIGAPGYRANEIVRPQKPQGWIASLIAEIRQVVATLRPFDRLTIILTGFAVTALCAAKPEGTAFAVTTLVLGALLVCLIDRWREVD
jgi:hypothetical protein